MRIGRLALFHKYVIGDPDDPYMIRYAIIKCPAFGLCIHKFVRSDYDRALHDHPWWFVSLILSGSYVEEYEVCNPGHRPTHIGADARMRAWVRRRPWDIAFRHAEWKHRVVLDRVMKAEHFVTSYGQSMNAYVPCWTLVLMGRRTRRWGFWMPNGSWCWWRRHNPTLNICEDHPIHAGGED